MARTNKIGIDYFPLDVDFFQNDKIQLVEGEFGIKGGYIAIRLLCKIYKENYFYKWGSDESLLFARNIGMDGVSSALVNEVVKALIRRGLFNELLYNQYKILTSVGIQQRYFEATKRYKNVAVFKEYLLIDMEEMENVIIYQINDNIDSINADINPQKKTKESKTKRNKNENEIENKIEKKKMKKREKIRQSLSQILIHL